MDWLFRLIKETTPLVPTSREGVGLFLSELGPVLIAVTYALYRLWRGDQTERQLMALLLLGFVLFVPLTVAVSRWAVYAQALAWLPWTLAALALFDADPSAVIVGRRIPLRAPLVGIFITAPLALALAVTPLVPSLTVTQQSPGRTSVGPQCDWFGMATHLSQRHATAGGGEQLLLTEIFRGSAMVWLTPYNVVGTSYGNTRALKDTRGFFWGRG